MATETCAQCGHPADSHEWFDDGSGLASGSGWGCSTPGCECDDLEVV